MSKPLRKERLKAISIVLVRFVNSPITKVERGFMRVLFGFLLLLISACASQNQNYTYTLDHKPYQELSSYDISNLAEKYVPHQTFDDRLKFINRLYDTVSTTSREYNLKPPSQLNWSMANLSNILAVEKYDVSGFYPYGYFESLYDDKIETIKTHLEVNKSFYESLRNASPAKKNCLESTYEECIQKLAQKLIITTKVGTTSILSLPQRDINKRIIGKNIGMVNIVAYVPYRRKSFRDEFLITIFFDPKTQKVKSVYIKGGVIPSIGNARTEEEYKNTNYYELISAISDNCPDSLKFYQQMSGVFKNPKTNGREYSSSVTSVDVSQSWYFKAKKVCDMKASYSSHAGLFVGSSAGEWREEGLYLSK